MSVPHIRIENDSVMGHQTRVFYISGKGEETEISSCVRALNLDIRVGEANIARLECYSVAGTTMAELAEVAVSELKPRRGWRARIREVTTFGNRGRTYVKA